MSPGAAGTDRDDAGLTLIDVVVAMTLMSVVLMIVTTGVVDMYRTANRADTAADSQTRILAAFNRLDRQIRYAERILVDGSHPTHWVAEFAMKDSANVRQCVQLRLPKATGGALTSQQWPAASSTTPTGTATTIAADVTRPSSAPFTLYPAGTAFPPGSTSSNFDRLAVTVSVRTGAATGSRAQIRDFDLQFTALNTVPAATDLNGCATD